MLWHFTIMNDYKHYLIFYVYIDAKGYSLKMKGR